MANDKHVDSSGIRLAPEPMRASSVNRLPELRQEYVLTPSLSVEETREERESTADDFQPKPEDRYAKLARRRTFKHMWVSWVMLALSLLTLAPYILSVAGVKPSLPIKVVPERFDVIGNLIEAFEISAKNGFKGADVNAVWLKCVPSIIIAIGLLFVIFNAIKSVFGIFGSTCSKRFLLGGSIYLIAIACVLVMSLVGVESVGIEKVNALDIIKNAKGEELAFEAGMAMIYFVFSAFLSAILQDSNGYVRTK